jgi:hypothetical protein
MNVEIGAEAAQFPEKEYINGIVVAVRRPLPPKKLIVKAIQQSKSIFERYWEM